MRRSIRVTLCLLFVFALAGAAFVTDAAALPKLSQPVAVSPADFQGFTNLPRTTTLAWDPSTPTADVASYSVTVEYSETAAGPYSAISGSPFTTTTPVTELELLGTTITQDGHYKWTVTAISTDTTKYLDSKPSVPAFFHYVTTKTLEMPTLQSPANHTHFKGLGSSPEITLAWDSRPAVTTATTDGYAVTVQVQDSAGLWQNALATDPTLVPLNWQNSSLTITPTVSTGHFRWAVQALGNNDTTGPAIDSPLPTNAGGWYYFYIQ